jgi:hypothetical protein
VKKKERFFKGPIKKVGQAKRLGVKSVKVLCGRLYMLGMLRQSEHGVENSFGKN